MSISFAPLQRSDLTDLTYAAIQDRILERGLRSGEQISVDVICTELGVSRTPVLDALKRLAADGLVEIRPRKGCFVRGLTARDVHEIFQLREAFEVAGIQVAIKTNRQDILAECLGECLREMKSGTVADDFVEFALFIRADRAFHSAIVDASNNARMAAIYRNLNVHLHIMRMHYLTASAGATGVHCDHEEIIGAIRCADLDAARRSIVAHLGKTERGMIETIDRAGGTI